MMTKRWLGRRGAVVAGIVLAGGLVAGGTAAYAAGTGNAPATTHPTPAKAAHKHPGKRRHPRLGAVGIHGEATVRNARTGAFVVREWQRGQVTAVNGDHLTVRSADGVSWTWTVEKNATITRDGKKITESTLKSGDTVLVVGRQVGTANDAGRVFAPSQAQLAKAAAKAKAKAATQQGTQA
jgi:hypothetical protein